MGTTGKTITLRSRLFAAPPVVGSFLRSASGRVVYRIVRVTTVRTVGADRFRMVVRSFG
jgi:hypothetical protein